jgi:pyruvate kinase
MTEVCCEVIHGGILAPEKGVNVPGVRLSVNSITAEDYKHLSFGLENGIDYVALSFVRETKDIIGVKDYLRKINRSIPLIAKIEKHEAIDNLNGIISEADGVMVARGDLGVEMPLKRVPLLQKDIIRRCNRVGKPVIVATQMLESMMRSPRPTRAEVSDVANAILDGTDAVMLSGETAVGQYPVESASMMNQITTEAELSLSYKRLLSARSDTLIPQTDDAIGYAACHIAAQLGAKAIIAYTSSGSTAQRVAKYRPETPILAIAANDEIRRKLALFWGVYSWKSETCSGVEEMFLQGARISIRQGFAREGDLVVVTAGIPLGFPGTTNLVKVQQVYKE